jgi:hypothetical protein
VLEADGSPAEEFLIKFEVSGIGARQVTSAKLRLRNTNPSGMGGSLYRVSDQSWQEETVTWSNAPSAQPGAVASLGAVAAGNWYELNVASVVQGDGVYSFRMRSTNGDGADYSSKEAGPGVAPQLVITAG